MKTVPKLSTDLTKNTKNTKNTKKETLMSSNIIDPLVTKTAEKIANVIDKDKNTINAIKTVKTVGRIRRKMSENNAAIPLSESIDNLHKVEDEANSDQFLPPKTIKKIINIAKSNPITNELLEEAKKFTFENKEYIKKQFQDLVAFYNVAYNKAFFYITAAEARLAIDYIKKCREGHVQQLQEQETIDKLIQDFIQSIITNKANLVIAPINSNTPELTDITRIKEVIDSECDKICGLEMLEIQKTQGIPKIQGIQNVLVNTFENCTNNFETFNKEKLKKIQEKINSNNDVPNYIVYNTKSNFLISEKYTCMDLSWLNTIFVEIEKCDLMVDAIIANSINVGNIRNFGNYVYTPCSKREFLKRKCIGSILNSDIYPCNLLGNNQIIMVSTNNTPSPLFINVIF